MAKKEKPLGLMISYDIDHGWILEEFNTCICCGHGEWEIIFFSQHKTKKELVEEGKFLAAERGVKIKVYTK
jgi:hypothetical protein